MQVEDDLKKDMFQSKSLHLVVQVQQRRANGRREPDIVCCIAEHYLAFGILKSE